LKTITSTLIRAQLHIPNIYVTLEKIEIRERNNYVKDIWKYAPILTIQKVPNYNLAMIFGGISSHKSLLIDVTSYIESL